MSLYEGTNGIQALDLMGRELNMRNGVLLQSFEKELDKFCQQNGTHPKPGDQVRALAGAAKRICNLRDGREIIDMPQGAFLRR